MLGEVQRALGKLGQAMESYRKAVTLDPNHPHARQRLTELEAASK